MAEHPIQGLMATAMESLKEMIEVNTIIGDPIETSEGTIIIPVSKVGFGFAAGGSEFSSQSNASADDESTLPFGGGSGGGVSISPVAFLIVNDQGVKMVHLQENVHIYEKLIEQAPQTLDKIQQILKDNTKNASQKKPDEDKQEQQVNFDI